MKRLKRALVEIAYESLVMNFMVALVIGMFGTGISLYAGTWEVMKPLAAICVIAAPIFVVLAVIRVLLEWLDR